MADAGELTGPEGVVTVHVDVDRHIWNYMNKSAKYRAKVEDIGRECGASVSDTDVENGDDCKTQVSVRGSTSKMVQGCSSQLLELVDECRQTVSTYPLHGLDALTCSTVVDNSSMLDDPASALVDVDSSAGVMRLTGTKEEINHALGLLEVLGVPLPSELPAPTAVSVEAAATPSLQLWKEDDEDTEDDNIYAGQRGDSPATIVVDATLWKYVQKSNGQWVAEITDVRERMGVVMTESLTADGAVSLTLAGVDDDAVAATDRVRRLLDRCRDDVQTVGVVCPDATIHAKVLKFLPHINKLPAYVAVQPDERMTATGTSKELEECTTKLVKLGASLATSCDADADGTATASDDEPVPSTPWLDRDGAMNPGGASGTVVQQNLAEDERIARQLQEEENAQRRERFVPTRVAGPSDDDGGQDGRQSGEIPVPIEHELWSFVEKRRAQQLQQLREAYRVKISTYPAAQDGFVMIAIDAESALMLECAQDELIQLLETLRGNVVVVQLGDEDDDGGRQIPPQVGQLFSQLAEGTDAVIEVKNNHITITGPEKAVAECQQKIAAFVQQVQQGQGMGAGGGGPGGMGGGGAGRGMRLGGGHGGGGMDMSSSSGVSDAEMARYMRTQGMQMPGYRGGADDVMRAMMMGGGGGGPMMMGGAGGGPDDDVGFFSMPGGASSFAPFARHPPNAMGVSRGRERMGGGMWQSEQVQTGGLESLGTRGPMRQGMFDTGARDNGADLRPFDGRADEDLMFPPFRPPMEQLPQPQQQQQQQGPAVKKPADESRESQVTKPRVVRFADEQQPAKQPRPPAVPATNVYQLHEAKACSVCQHTPREGETGTPCQHAFCVSCVQQYFSDGQPRCPVCGVINDDSQQQQRGVATQPDDGVMMITYDNAFRLPGYETTSRGTIVVCYIFPPGVQKDYQPNPGRKYNGVSMTAFFPLSTEGSNIVDLLQRAFDDRQVFAMAPTTDGKSEEITWNGIHHKTNIYGGPKKYGYPDPIYMKRVQHELHTKGFH